MSTLVIDRKAIKANLAAVKAKASGVEIIADLTGDACGMGLLETARILRDEGVRTYAVWDSKDAETLRSAGFIEERIMVLRSTSNQDELEKLIDLGVICTVGSYDAAVALNGVAEKHRTVCEVQIKIDTGLGRYGFIGTETDKIAAIYKYMPNLAIVGVFSTYAHSWKNKKVAESQYLAFKQMLTKLTEMGFEHGTTHMADSAALFRYSFGRMDAVRVGNALAGRVRGVSGLTRVGTIEAEIQEVGWFPKSHRVGGKVLREPARLAVLSIGYYHGFGVTRRDREVSVMDILKARMRKPTVKINGQRVRIVGKIGMTHTIVDVTKLDCRAGDIAVMEADPLNVKAIPRVYR